MNHKNIHHDQTSPNENKYFWLIVAVLAVLKLLIHSFTASNYELHRDAYLYLALGDHLAWGFASVPPMIGVLAKLVTITIGDSVFAVRLLPALAGTISVVLVSLIVREIGGRKWAVMFAAVAFIFSPAFLGSNVLFQPVSFNQFFWLLGSYFFVLMLKQQESKYWLHLGIIFGLAFLNKYSVVFYALAIMTGLLLSDQRKLFASRYTIAGILLGLLIILPNLIWQHQHNWPVIHHMEELRRNQLVHVRLPDFIASQIWMHLTSTLVWLAGLGWLLFSRNSTRYRAFGYSYFLLLILLIMLHGKFYYTIGIYSMLFAAGGVALEHWFSGRLRLLRPVTIILIVILSIPILPASLPLLSYDKMAAYFERMKYYGFEGALRWEDGRIHQLPQDYADMTGWKELASLVVRTYEGLTNSEKKSCTIYSENYGQAGAVRYYDRQHGLPEPVSFSDNFLFWAPDTLSGDILIYINDNAEGIRSLFDSIEKIGEIRNIYAREFGTAVYLCRNPKPGAGEFYRNEVHRLKELYQR